MSITNPQQLVEEFKKSGEFDRLRRELLKGFRQRGVAAFLARVEDIAKQKLASDPKLQYMPEANVSREIMQELDRYPIVERAVQEASLLSKSSMVGGIKDSMRKILQEDRRAPGQTFPRKTDGGAASVKTAQQQNGNDGDTDSSDAESMDMDIDDDESD
ncbi:hypothetical protein C8Q80DRAFT_1156583 [Daedaleopsis nitida]|nr:hypothetical protein C8Q80DRAFT_1156583 [Daedaleopsis nitida]